MNHSKLYVPDPNVWIIFFKKSSQKRVINQKGGNQMNSTRHGNEPTNVELVSPVEAADERTQSAVKRIRKKAAQAPSRRKTHIKRRAKPRPSRKRKILKPKGQKSKLKGKTNGRRKNKSVKTARDIFSR